MTDQNAQKGLPPQAAALLSQVAEAGVDLEALGDALAGPDIDPKALVAMVGDLVDQPETPADRLMAQLAEAFERRSREAGFDGAVAAATAAERIGAQPFGPKTLDEAQEAQRFSLVAGQIAGDLKLISAAAQRWAGKHKRRPRR